MVQFSAVERNAALEGMGKEQFDLLVIGGGITGAGIALDAVTRGLKVALVEMQDFASGTSSRSTKLVHGGLRYLKQFEIKEVAELGKERAIVYENGPHVTTPEWMLLPFHKGGTFGKVSTSFGLRVYDFLAGVKKAERRRMLSKEETISKAPLVKKEGLLGGGLYVEYRTDDARLTIEVIKAASEKGASIVNYAKADKFIYNDQKEITGVTIVDVLTGKSVQVQANKVVNATGPWVDDLRGVDGSKSNKSLILSKGVHLVFNQSIFPLDQAVYFDTPDGRMVFAIPRDGKTYVGTTDTFFKGNPKDMSISKEDRHYILNAIQYMFPEINVLEKDIESSWAGVRPLIHEDGKNPSEISRKDEIWESESGLITIAGGKLTGYRKMAETVVNMVVKKLDGEQKFTACLTRNLPISGGEVGGSSNMQQFVIEKVKKGQSIGLEEKEARQLVKLYGSNVDVVFSYLKENSKNLPQVLYMQLMYAIHHEMAVKPTDFFIRRTGQLLFNIATVYEWKDQVISEMSSIFNWTEVEKIKYEEELNLEILSATTVL
ncbi:glycerol-3-phosphate dehydrogenase/oxidase [Viridibacillus sp. YIM B01967]|uniref:Glycerol-3-phosphate dehydrogenase n=1 Tax=Viridibacillus soli TaxID=2798301 RepID=A0ABS1H5S1_9BACL|nr:glycerol-3-phosphate dehydrogenase/oxidase [Viridibacillus soli]MBK3494768.1 glycerol-3-phosphate dehydrogenase/oxidase [Viridibacillus soli]